PWRAHHHLRRGAERDSHGGRIRRRARVPERLPHGPGGGDHRLNALPKPLAAACAPCYSEGSLCSVNSRDSLTMATRKTILVVDDDQELSDGLRVVLERQGFHVIQARDGQQGKQMVYHHRPDLMILDMMMPRMGGYPVLEHFRGKQDAPPIIMITANEGSRHKAYAEYLGVVDYIRKPFAMERLLESVHRGLTAAEERKKAAQEPQEQ